MYIWTAVAQLDTALTTAVFQVNEKKRVEYVFFMIKLDEHCQFRSVEAIRNENICSYAEQTLQKDFDEDQDGSDNV